MRIPVIFKSYKKETPNRGYWDYAMIEDLFKNKLWKTGFEFEVYEESPIEFRDSMFDPLGTIIVLPARYHADMIDQINKDLAKFTWVLLILIGDEEAIFPIDKLVHPNMKVWVMSPQPKKYKNIDRFILNGWSTNTRELLLKFKAQMLNKTLDWFFCGQITHQRRIECAQSMELMNKGIFIKRDGFAQGDREIFFGGLADAKVAPCPSGAVIPDSFRIAEAFEAGCLPIVDALSPKIQEDGYWNYIFGDEVPFPILKDWKDLPGTVEYFRDTYPKFQNIAFAWWQKYKRQMALNLAEDLNYLIGTKNMSEDINDQLTVIIPTSPIKDHPDTTIIEKTIQSIRDHLPTVEIIIAIDGIRTLQEDYTERYQEYIKRLVWLCNYKYKNVLPVVFPYHKHQVGMTREILKQVKTPLIMFVEHDTPICEEIPFKELGDLVKKGEFNMIRLHHEALILEEHKYLMLDKEPLFYNGIPIVRTGQWSQRPHIANTQFYREILDKNFSQDAISMIEDGIYSVVSESFRLRAKAGWNEFKVGIYAPKGDMKRSYHLDGRKGDSKFDMKF